MTIYEWMKSTLPELKEYDTFDGVYRDCRPRLVCNDGFSMSVQSNTNHHYCRLREFVEQCFEVEIGYPSEPEPLIIEYAEDRNDLTQTVYAYVPFDVVQHVVEKHGGIQEIDP